MKLVKVFGVVMAVHAAVFMFIFAIPGCRSTGNKPVAAAPVVGDAAGSPVNAPEANAPVSAPATTTSADVAAVRFSPTRPGSPLAAEVTAPVAPAVATASTYAVVKGDNLWIIAKKNGVTVKQLTAANNLRADSRLSLGQKLVIPGKTAVAPTALPAAVGGKTVEPSATAHSVAASAAAPAAPITHVVKSGESLGSIAKKYQVKVGDIATANNIADPTKIRVGQTLKIPGSHAAATKPAASAAKPAVKPATAASAVAPAAKPAPATAPVFTSPLLESAPAAAPAANESPLIAPSTSATDAPVIRVEEPAATKTP